MTPDEFRRHGHYLIDWIADYRERLEELPVMASTAPGWVKGQLPATPPQQPEEMSQVFADIDNKIMPGLSHFQHPRFFGYFPATASLDALLGDMMSGGLGTLGLTWQAAPAMAELEEVATDWVRQMLGLSKSWAGSIQEAASTSTLVATLSARERASNYSAERGGIAGEKAPLTAYLSAQAHSSVDKAMLMAGFGRENLRKIETDADYAMKPEALAAAIAADRAAGAKPALIVATCGTTASTAFDPIDRIAEIAEPERIWLHVDAAMAGSAMILPECRKLWQGIERADSLVTNPHKWLGTNFDCSLYYVRDPAHLIRVMSTSPSYLKSIGDGEVRSYRDWGIPLGRRFRALKLWFLIRGTGVAGLQARIRRDLDNAQWLAEQVRATKDWKVVAPVQLQTVCIRHEPAGLVGARLDAHTQDWAEQINRSGLAYLTPAILGERWMVRLSIGSLGTERRHVAETWAAIRRIAEGAEVPAR